MLLGKDSRIASVALEKVYTEGRKRVVSGIEGLAIPWPFPYTLIITFRPETRPRIKKLCLTAAHTIGMHFNATHGEMCPRSPFRHHRSRWNTVCWELKVTRGLTSTTVSLSQNACIVQCSNPGNSYSIYSCQSLSIHLVTAFNWIMDFLSFRPCRHGAVRSPPVSVAARYITRDMLEVWPREAYGNFAKTLALGKAWEYVYGSQSIRGATAPILPCDEVAMQAGI